MVVVRHGAEARSLGVWEGHTNWLAHLAGMRDLRVSLAEYLGIRVGAERAALASAMAVWCAMPPLPAAVP